VEVERVEEEPAAPARNEREAEADANGRAAQQARAYTSEGPSPNPLAQALMLAIDAVEEASRHGMKKYDWDEGLHLGEDAIVKLAITAYIQSQGGNAAWQ